jgi:glycosyltransferase involved in cell wall biosynthesis
MKVSVVIATYNRAYILAEALESALAQTYRDTEIIIVDDGSTDHTAEMVSRWTDERVRYIKHDRNRGCSAAYNTGISAATGDLITLLDSDDKWMPDNLERQVRFFLAHPEVDVVFTDVKVEGAGTAIPSLINLMRVFPTLINRTKQGEEFVINNREMYICLLQEIPVKPTATLVRRELFTRSGVFNEDWPSGTDWDLFLRFSRSACFGYIDSPLSVQTRTSDATHNRYAEKDKLFLVAVLTAEKSRLKNDNEALKAVNRGIRDQCDHLAFQYLQSGKRLKSIATYLRGYKETYEFGMLWRAGAALMPLRMRSSLKAAVKKA